jgi:hypothetical protein
LSSYAGVVKLTAIFESWHIGDGNYPPLRRGQQVNLSFEVDPSASAPATAGEADSFIHLGGGEYEFTGMISRVYADDSDTPVTVVRCGKFRFYINRHLPVNEEERLRGKGTLLLDHYLWVEFLDPLLKPARFVLPVDRGTDTQVQIPPSLIARHRQSKSFPTSLPSAQYDPAHAQEIETLEGQAFDEEFYLPDLIDENVCTRVPGTFI